VEGSIVSFFFYMYILIKLSRKGTAAKQVASPLLLRGLGPSLGCFPLGLGTRSVRQGRDIVFLLAARERAQVSSASPSSLPDRGNKISSPNLSMVVVVLHL
jgi:hypothetical protein